MLLVSVCMTKLYILQSTFSLWLGSTRGFKIFYKSATLAYYFDSKKNNVLFKSKVIL